MTHELDDDLKTQIEISRQQHEDGSTITITGWVTTPDGIRRAFGDTIDY